MFDILRRLVWINSGNHLRQGDIIYSAQFGQKSDSCRNSPYITASKLSRFFLCPVIEVFTTKQDTPGVRLGKAAENVKQRFTAYF